MSVTSHRSAVNPMAQAHDVPELTELVEDHWAILKIGPGLTFALREALFALAAIEDELVDEAPHPVLAGLEGSDDRMVAPAGVGRSMTVGRRVAAADVAAGHARPEVDPPGADAQAVLAAVRGGHDLPDQVAVGARLA